jgi:hypothetical protein
MGKGAKKGLFAGAKELNKREKVWLSRMFRATMRR